MGDTYCNIYYSPLATQLIAYTEMYTFFQVQRGLLLSEVPVFSNHHMLSMHSKLYMLFFGCLASKNFKIKMVKSYFKYGNVLKVERYTVINVMRNTTAELTILFRTDDDIHRNIESFS